MDTSIQCPVPADRVVPVETLHKPSPEAKFMFVTDTGQRGPSKAFKVAFRQDIRSFVQKNTSRHFKDIHSKKSRRTEKEQPWRLLAPVIDSGTLAVESATGADTRETLVSYDDAYSGVGNSLKCSHRAREKSQKMILEKRRLHRLLEPSPLEILGASRIDPFLSYPIDNPDRSLPELMDYGEPYNFNATCRIFSKIHLLPQNDRDFTQAYTSCSNYILCTGAPAG